MITKLSTLLGIVAIIFAAYFYIDERYAQCDDVKKIERRLDYKIAADQLDYKEQRISKIREQYPDPNKMPKIVKEELDKLLREQKHLEKKLESLEKK